MAVRIKCESCHTKFLWDIAVLGWPSFCPVPECGHDNSLPEGDEVVMPHIGKSIGRTGDRLYREMEAGSEFRAELAGEPSLKMTNMQDNLRAGDIAEMPLAPSPVSDMIAAVPGAFGHNNAQGIAYSGAVSQGPFPNAGARMQQALRAVHAQNTGHNAPLTSDRPANEVSSPLYQRRV